MPFEYRLRHDARFQDGTVRIGVYTIVGDLYPSVRARFLDKYCRDTLVLYVSWIVFPLWAARGTSRGDGASNVNRRLFLDICFPVDCKSTRD